MAISSSASPSFVWWNGRRLSHGSKNHYNNFVLQHFFLRSSKKWVSFLIILNFWNGQHCLECFAELIRMLWNFRVEAALRSIGVVVPPPPSHCNAYLDENKQKMPRRVEKNNNSAAVASQTIRDKRMRLSSSDKVQYGFSHVSAWMIYYTAICSKGGGCCCVHKATIEQTTPLAGRHRTNVRVSLNAKYMQSISVGSFAEMIWHWLDVVRHRRTIHGDAFALAITN